MPEDRNYTLLDTNPGDIIEYTHPTNGHCLVYVMEPLTLQIGSFFRVSQYKNGRDAWLIETPALHNINIIARGVNNVNKFSIAKFAIITCTSYLDLIKKAESKAEGK